jgi:hypothetical protein
MPLLSAPTYASSDFTKNIKDHDLIFLVETWSNQTDSIPGFKAISTCTATPKTNSSCRISGGITLLIKNTLQPLIYTEKLTKNFLWCRIDKSILDSLHDLFKCEVYIPPEKSPYYDVEIFKDLENDIAEFSTKGNMTDVEFWSRRMHIDNEMINLIKLHYLLFELHSTRPKLYQK